MQCRLAACATAAKAGIGFGSALAITISWSQQQSILWAIIHGFLGWIYVIYYWLTNRDVTRTGRGSVWTPCPYYKTRTTRTPQRAF